MFSQPEFWVAVVQIVWIDLVLSGDNAVVIAMACRDLPKRERRLGMTMGAGLAATLLVMFTLVVTALLQLPGLRLVAGCALIFIAIKLLGPRVGHTGAGVQPAQGLWRAVWLIVAADVVMSLDNAVAVASVANGRYVLLGLGLAISIPTVVAGSAIVLRLMRRFPIIVWAGAAILGWVAGELVANDPIVAPHASALLPGAGPLETRTGLNVVELALALLGVAVVLLSGVVRRREGTRRA